jgi:hypothetical protein
MPSAEAHVQTSSGGPPEVLHAECSETEGSIVLSWGRCAMKAAPDSLALHADAADEESLRRIQDMIAGRLEKFGRRENLSVTWHPAQAEIP